MRKVWIEAALNGPWSRALQGGIPDTVEAIVAEGVACARAGATIIGIFIDLLHTGKSIRIDAIWGSLRRFLS
jgi:uncharacterized protein (DUF849 family)